MNFSFDDSFKISNITFDAAKGELIGVSGEVRSGKSMLLKALSGIYSYTGSIKLNDIELASVKNYKIDNFIAYQEKEGSIFTDTIKSNITLGANVDVDKVLSAVYLDNDISCFKDKENEMIYHTVSNLSGGQTQRLLIARAILSNSRLILLDDLFNSFDNNMSVNILENIRAYMASSLIS